MAKDSKKSNRVWSVYIDFLVDDHIVRKMKFQKVNGSKVAKAEYEKWKLIHDQWNGKDIKGAFVACDNVRQYGKVYAQYDENGVIFDNEI